MRLPDMMTWAAGGRERPESEAAEQAAEHGSRGAGGKERFCVHVTLRSHLPLPPLKYTPPPVSCRRELMTWAYCSAGDAALSGSRLTSSAAVHFHFTRCTPPCCAAVAAARFARALHNTPAQPRRRLRRRSLG